MQFPLATKYFQIFLLLFHLLVYCYSSLFHVKGMEVLLGYFSSNFDCKKTYLLISLLFNVFILTTRETSCIIYRVRQKKTQLVFKKRLQSLLVHDPLHLPKWLQSIRNMDCTSGQTQVSCETLPRIAGVRAIQLLLPSYYSIMLISMNDF